MPDRFEVRLADIGDIDAIGELTVRSYVDGGFVSEQDDYVAELRDTAERMREAEVWVATVAGDVQAAITFCPPGSTYRERARPGEGEFRMLAVDPAARGRGLARALIRRCLDRCVEIGLGEMVLCSMAEMRPAHALYTSLGFVRDADLDWEPAAGVRLLGFRAAVPPASDRLRDYRVAPHPARHPGGPT